MTLTRPNVVSKLSCSAVHTSDLQMPFNFSAILLFIGSLPRERPATNCVSHSTVRYKHAFKHHHLMHHNSQLPSLQSCILPLPFSTSPAPASYPPPPNSPYHHPSGPGAPPSPSPSDPATPSHPRGANSPARHSLRGPLPPPPHSSAHAAHHAAPQRSSARCRGVRGPCARPRSSRPGNPAGRNSSPARGCRAPAGCRLGRGFRCWCSA